MGLLNLQSIVLTTEPESQNSEEVSNSLDNYKQPTNESLIVDNSVFDIAPGKDKETKFILFNEYCEELAFPSLFPN